jgi:hypothetical protein
MKLAGANPLGHFGDWPAASIIIVMGWTGPTTPFHAPAIAPIDHAVLAARPSAP